MKKSKKAKKSNSWKLRHRNDRFFKKSKILGYRSRASFKLIELDEKYKFLKKNSNILDLGSYPGGWSQVASQKVTSGRILSIDIKLMKPINNVKFYKNDIFNEETKKKILDFFPGKIDAIISDMAADTTGNKTTDSIRTNQLCSEVVDFSIKILKQEGVLISKLFMGKDFVEVKNLAKSIFKTVSFFKPKSSRSDSKETYLHCKTLKTL